ncbi:PTS transporter subunit IIC [Staphylococcus aureus]
MRALVYVHESISDGQNFIVFSLIQGVTFAAGVFIILTGVRLIFRWSTLNSEKLVPNSKPAFRLPMCCLMHKMQY